MQMRIFRLNSYGSTEFHAGFKYYVIKWIEEEAVKASIFAGIFFALAYLVRPEAFLIVGAIAVAVLLSTFFVRNRRPLLIGVLSLVGVFAFAASPYVAFLSK